MSYLDKYLWGKSNMSWEELKKDVSKMDTRFEASFRPVSALPDLVRELEFYVSVLEGLSKRLGITMEEAIDHINHYGSHHTDAIVTESRENASRFVSLVDSSSVMVNCSTRFADGYRYGKGAEVGISTNKIHARGPVGMEGLMIYKYVLIGDGQAVVDYSGPGGRKFSHRRLEEDYPL